MRVHLPLIGLFVFACAVSLQASGNPARLSVATHPSQRLKVQNVKLEPMPRSNGVPNAMLSFEILNAGEDDVSQIVVEVEVTEKTISSSYPATPKVVAGPYTLMGRNKLMATHTWHVEMVLRNLSSDCACTANVTVVSFGEDQDRGPAETVVSAGSYPSDTDSR